MSLKERINRILPTIKLNPFRINGYPPFQKELFLSTEEYLMCKGTSEGELDMIKLAETADQEDHWTHFEDTGFWYHPQIMHKTRVDLETGIIGMGYSTISIKKEAAKNMGLGEDIVEYHIHPDSFIDMFHQHNPPEKKLPRGFYKTKMLPYPNGADFKTTLNLPNREHRIATSLGITSYRIHTPDIKSDEDWHEIIMDCYLNTELRLSELQEAFRDPYNSPRDEVLAYGIIRNLNRTIGDYATIEFTPKISIEQKT